MVKACTYKLLFFTLLVGLGHCVWAQEEDSVKRVTVDNFLRRQKGFIGKLAKNLLRDTSAEVASHLVQRTDLPFQKYAGLVIRSIVIRPLDFGISIGDTTKALNNKLTRIVNGLHKNTVTQTVRNNIFFKKNTPLSPFLLGANERHLRDLSYINDAKIIVQPAEDGSDSVDITILTKDVYSLGGGADVHGIDRVAVSAQDDNLFGRGDDVELQFLYDRNRKETFGYGGQFVKRNIGGSFIDAHVGYRNFSRSFTTGNPEECITFFRLIKPLVHSFMKWTYALDASSNASENMYSSDSVYNTDARYRFKNFDAWAGWNLSADKLTGDNDGDRLNLLLGMRVLKKKFDYRPENFKGRYFYRYTDFSAVLGAVSVFRQNFYKTQYIYGFGRNEDVPEGVDLSVTAGWTKKEERERPYLALDYQRYFFTPREHYFSLVLRGGSFFYKKKFEDVALLAGVEYFSRLKQLNKYWKQRTFINASIGRQLSYQLNDPLVLESKYGLEDFPNDQIAGDLRASLRAESVFYSPWAPLLFKLAPFVFGHASVFGEKRADLNTRKLYSAVGGGLRTRNESLIFGTVEVRGIYYGVPNYYNEHWRIEFNTNIRFRYNKQFIKRPELVVLN